MKLFVFLTFLSAQFVHGSMCPETPRKVHSHLKTEALSRLPLFFQRSNGYPDTLFERSILHPLRELRMAQHSLLNPPWALASGDGSLLFPLPTGTSTGAGEAAVHLKPVPDGVQLTANEFFDLLLDPAEAKRLSNLILEQGTLRVVVLTPDALRRAYEAEGFLALGPTDGWVTKRNRQKLIYLADWELIPSILSELSPQLTDAIAEVLEPSGLYLANFSWKARIRAPIGESGYGFVFIYKKPEKDGVDLFELPGAPFEWEQKSYIRAFGIRVGPESILNFLDPRFNTTARMLDLIVTGKGAASFLDLFISGLGRNVITRWVIHSRLVQAGVKIFSNVYAPKPDKDMRVWERIAQEIQTFPEGAIEAALRRQPSRVVITSA